MFHWLNPNFGHYRFPLTSPSAPATIEDYCPCHTLDGFHETYSDVIVKEIEMQSLHLSHVLPVYTWAIYTILQSCSLRPVVLKALPAILEHLMVNIKPERGFELIISLQKGVLSSSTHLCALPLHLFNTAHTTLQKKSSFWLLLHT